MTGAHVGFYVHYHGMGHKHRTEAILNYLNIPATVITSRMEKLQWSGPRLEDVVGIACDNEGLSQIGLQHAGDVPALHFAPLWSTNMALRAAAYTHWLAKVKPATVVIDVSVEISMLTRLAAIPQIIMRQHGDRNDPAHLNAYAGAHSLLAPFPAMLEDDITPQWVREKTVYLSGFSRAKPRGFQGTSHKASDFDIVFLFGRGGVADMVEHLSRAAAKLPEYKIAVLGKEHPEEAGPSPTNLHYLGWVEDVTAFIRNAQIVVTAAGHNSVMELGEARKRFIAIAEPRPFAEQLRKVEILRREGLAVGLDRWPDADAWPSLIETAKKIDVCKWDRIFNGNGAKQAADHIEEVAGWSQHHWQAKNEFAL